MNASVAVRFWWAVAVLYSFPTALQHEWDFKWLMFGAIAIVFVVVFVESVK